MLCRLNGMPDLATESSYVQGVISTYMKKLLALGVDGFRIDAAKHQQPGSLNTILNTVKAAYPTTLAGESIWVTQEVIPDGNVVRSDYYQNGTLNEFQFTYAMRDVFRNNNGLNLASIPTVMGTPGNWGGTWGFVQPAYATVFVNNWDTERSGTDSLNASNYTGATNDSSGTKRYDLPISLCWRGPTVKPWCIPATALPPRTRMPRPPARMTAAAMRKSTLTGTSSIVGAISPIWLASAPPPAARA